MGEVAKRMPAKGNGPGQNRERNKSKKRSGKKMWIMAGLILFFMIAGVAGAVVWQIEGVIKEVSTPHEEDGVETVDPSLTKEYKADQPISLLILGKDTRKNIGMLNTDVMMVAVIRPESKKVTMLSIPRDTRVKLSGYGGYEKANGIYAIGENLKKREESQGKAPTINGILLTKKTLSEMLGIPIQYYVEVDFEGFKAVVDELKGIEINVDRRLVYDDPTDGTHINLKAGLQTLNGKQALDYVRHRQDNRGERYYSSDYDRNRRQQEVIRAVIDKMKTFDGITKAFDILKIGGKHIRTDLPEEKIKGLALDFKDFSSQSITTLESGAYWGWLGNLGYTFFPKDKMEEIRTTLQTEMGIKPDAVGPLDNASIGNSGGQTPSSRPSTPKPAVEPVKTPEKPAETTAPPKKAQEQKPAQQGDGSNTVGTTPDQSGTIDPINPDDVLPPPDIAPPTDLAPVSPESQEAPPDLIQSSNP